MRIRLEPLGTWCPVALAVSLFAVGARGDLGALAPALVVGASAALLLWAGNDAPSPARTATTSSRPEPAAAGAHGRIAT